MQIIQWKKTSPRKSTNIKRTLDILRATLAASVGTGTAVVVGGAWVELKLDFTFTAAKVLNWAVIVDNVRGAVHL